MKENVKEVLKKITKDKDNFFNNLEKLLAYLIIMDADGEEIKEIVKGELLKRWNCSKVFLNELNK